MQKAETKEKQEQREVEKKKIEDISAWSLVDVNGNKGGIKDSKNADIKVVGYSELVVDEGSPIVGRKAWGVIREPPKPVTSLEVEIDEGDSEEDEKKSKSGKRKADKGGKKNKVKKRKSDTT